MSNKGKLVVLSAPSGAGKTSICKELLKRNKIHVTQFGAPYNSFRISMNLVIMIIKIIVTRRSMTEFAAAPGN